MNPGGHSREALSLLFNFEVKVMVAAVAAKTKPLSAQRKVSTARWLGRQDPPAGSNFLQV